MMVEKVFSVSCLSSFSQSESSDQMLMFVVSKKNARIKPLDLGHLDIADQLHKMECLHKEKRFVFCQRNADGTICIRTTGEIAKKLKAQQDTLGEESPISIKEVSAEEYEMFCTLFLQALEKEEKKMSDSTEVITPSQKSNKSSAQHTVTKERSLPSVVHRKVKVSLNRMLSKLVQDYNENLRAEKRRKQEIEKAEKILVTGINKQTLKKEIQKREVLHLEGVQSSSP